MQEIFEKIVERLRNQRYLNSYEPVNIGWNKALVKAIEIVNQLAEDYNNDFCEWKFETTGIVWHCNGCETYNLPYAMNLRIIADDFECKCPHCGKKIKVVE